MNLQHKITGTYLKTGKTFQAKADTFLKAKAQLVEQMMKEYNLNKEDFFNEVLYRIEGESLCSPSHQKLM